MGKNIYKFKALRDIHGVCVAGNIYDTKDMKRLFPYIDFTNTDYFEEVFEHKFNIGDTVRYTGTEHTYGDRKNLNRKTPYKVTKVINQVRNDNSYVYYDIISTVSDHQFTISEKELEIATPKYIISFSGSKYTSKPDIHELNFYSYEHKVKGTWKEMFVFDTQEEATRVACVFAKHTIMEIVNIINNPNSIPMNKFNIFKNWLYTQDWKGSPEENHAHNCVIAKFEELGLDSI